MADRLVLAVPVVVLNHMLVRVVLVILVIRVMLATLVLVELHLLLLVIILLRGTVELPVMVVLAVPVVLVVLAVPVIKTALGLLLQVEAAGVLEGHRAIRVMQDLQPIRLGLHLGGMVVLVVLQGAELEGLARLIPVIPTLVMQERVAVVVEAAVVVTVIMVSVVTTSAVEAAVVVGVEALAPLLGTLVPLVTQGLMPTMLVFLLHQEAATQLLSVLAAILT